MKKNGRSKGWMRSLDRTLGPPILLIVSLLNRSIKKKAQMGEGNICLVKTSAIGDTVLLLSVVSAIREKFPGRSVDLICANSNAPFAKLIPGIRNLIVIPATNPLKSIFMLLKLKRYAAVIDFGSWPRLDAIYTAMVSADVHVGFKSKGQYRHFAYDIVVKHDKSKHELENYSRVCQKIGINELGRPRLDWPYAANVVVDREGTERRAESYVVFHLWPGGSRALEKQWSPENWIILAKEIVEKRGLDLVFTGGALDYERNFSFIRSIDVRRNSAIFNAAGLSIKESIEVLRGARLVVSIDTGIMHIASALDRPLVSLHGPTHSARWGGLGARTYSVDATLSVSEAPISLGYEAVNEKLMDKIGIERVVNAVSNQLALVDQRNAV